jgi:hypothetical protein
MIVHCAFIGDCEDPYIYAGFALSEWQHTEKGSWVLEHALEQPVFHCTPNVSNYGYDAIVDARFNERDKTYFILRWDSK